MGSIGTDGAYRGTVTFNGIIGYNGSWDSTWGTPGNRSSYAGRNRYYTVFKFTLGTDYSGYSDTGWIALSANMLSNVRSQTYYDRTISFGLSKTAPTPGSSTVGLPSSFIGGAKSKVFTVNNQSASEWFQVGSLNSPISLTGGTTYYLWVWSTNSNEVVQFYIGSSYYNTAAAMIAKKKYTITISDDSYTTAYINNGTSSVTAEEDTNLTLKGTAISHTSSWLYFIKTFVLPNGTNLSPSNYVTTYSVNYSINTDGVFRVTGQAISANPGTTTSSISAIGSTTASLKISGYSSPKFTIVTDNTYYIVVSTSSLSSPVTSITAKTTTSLSSRAKTVSLTGLTAKTTYNYGVYCKNKYNNYYYKTSGGSFTTDASSYAGTISVSNIGTTTATFTHGTLASTTNLNNYWYLTTKHSASTVASSSFNANIGSGTRGSSIAGSGLSEATTQTVYAYVYSSASGYYHKVGSVSVPTSASGYTGKATITGITGTSATLCLFAVSPTANMDSGYYITTTNYGSTTTTTPGTRIAIKNSTVITGLIPGKQYTYYFYMKNTANNTFYLVSTQTFETYSSLVTYQGQPHRVWYYNRTNSRWEAAILKQGGSNVTITNLLPELGFKNVNNTATNVSWNTTYKHFGEGSICLKPTSAATEFTWPVSYKSGLGHNSNPYQTQNHIYYLSMWVYQPTKVGSIDFYWPIAEPVFMASKTTSASGKWTKISARNSRSNWTSGNQSCRIDFNNPDGTNGTYYADIMLVDLTATFGSGKEPSQDWCDKNIPYIPVKGSVFISSEEPDWT